MNNYITDEETLAKLVDGLIAKKYPNQDLTTLGELRSASIQSLDDQIATAVFGSLTEEQIAELNQLLDSDASDPAAFDEFFKNAGVDLEQKVAETMQAFSENFLGGGND